MTMPGCVLVVEDELVVAFDIEQLLRDMEYRVLLSSTSADAERLARLHRPDLLLVDVQLNDQRDGITTASAIKEFLDVPIVYLTAFSDAETSQRIGATQPYGYIVKPFDERTLKTTIETARIRHTHDQELRNRELWFSHTLSCVADGIITTDRRGTISYVNRAGLRLLKMPAEEIIGKPIIHVLRIEQQDASVHPLQQMLSDALPTMAWEAMVLNGQHELCWIHVAATQIMPKHGESLGIVCLFHDVTPRRAAEQQRIEDKQRIDQLKHLDRLRTFSTERAHELNNMLSGILGYTQLIQFSLSPDARTQQALAEIEGLSKQAAMLIKQMIRYAGQAKQVSEFLNLNDVVSAVLGTLRQTMLRDCHLHWLPDPDLPAVEGDSGQLYQAIENLLLNAYEAIQLPRGEITILTGLYYTDTGLSLQTATGVQLTPGAYVLLAIQDTGVGIAPDDLSGIYDSFFSTKGTGRGLGLPIVLSNLRDHNGMLFVQSQLEQGTTCIVLLPCMSQLSMLHMPHFPPVQPTILVVHDEETEVGAGLETIAEHGTTTYLSYQEALKHELIPEATGHLLIETNLQTTSGLQTFRHYRQRFPTLSIVLINRYHDGVLDEVQYQQREH